MRVLLGFVFWANEGVLNFNCTFFEWWIRVEIPCAFYYCHLLHENSNWFRWWSCVLIFLQFSVFKYVLLNGNVNLPSHLKWFICMNNGVLSIDVLSKFEEGRSRWCHGGLASYVLQNYENLCKIHAKSWTVNEISLTMGRYSFSQLVLRRSCNL